MTNDYLTWQRDDLVLNCAHFVVSPTLIEPLHGHTYSIRIKVEGKRTESSMIVDFLELKSIVKRIIEKFNFTVFIPQSNPLLSVEFTEGFVKVIVLPTKSEYVFPRYTVSLLPKENSTVECISEYLTELITEELRPNYPNLTKIQVSAGEYSKSVATAVDFL